MFQILSHTERHFLRNTKALSFLKTNIVVDVHDLQHERNLQNNSQYKKSWFHEDFQRMSSVSCFKI